MLGTSSIEFTAFSSSVQLRLLYIFSILMQHTPVMLFLSVPKLTKSQILSYFDGILTNIFCPSFDSFVWTGRNYFLCKNCRTGCAAELRPARPHGPETNKLSGDDHFLFSNSSISVCRMLGWK